MIIRELTTIRHYIKLANSELPRLPSTHRVFVYTTNVLVYIEYIRLIASRASRYKMPLDIEDLIELVGLAEANAISAKFELDAEGDAETALIYLDIVTDEIERIKKRYE